MLVLYGGVEREIQQFRVFKELADQLDGPGTVEAVGHALVNGKAEVYTVAELSGSVLVVEPALLLFSDLHAA